jgi:hypothetical protein
VDGVYGWTKNSNVLLADIPLLSPLDIHGVFGGGKRALALAAAAVEAACLRGHRAARTIWAGLLRLSLCELPSVKYCCPSQKMAELKREEKEVKSIAWKRRCERLRRRRGRCNPISICCVPTGSAIMAESRENSKAGS